jgi:ACS family glucarate transporter-like MFS transporter
MKTRYKVLVLLFLVSAITYLDRICLSVAGPAIQSSLGLRPDQWGWVVGTFVLTYALFAMPSASLGERYGARKVLPIIVLWWSVFTFLTGAAVNYPMLIVTSLLFGAGESGGYPNATGAISHWFPKAERARAVGVVWTAARIGGALASIIVVPILKAYGWRMPFYVFACTGVVWAAIWYAWYRDNPAQKKGVKQAELEELQQEPKSAAPSGAPWAVVLSSGNVRYLMAMYFAYIFGGYFYLSWLPTYLVKGRGFTQEQMAIWSSLPFMLGACGTLVGGVASDFLGKKYGLKIARRTVGAAGLGLSGALELAAVLTHDSTLAAIFLGVGFGFMDCMLPASWAACLDIGRKYAGTVSGAMHMAGQAGAFLSTIAFGYMVKAFNSYDLPLVPMAIALFISSALWFKIDPTKPVVAEAVEQVVA